MRRWLPDLAVVGWYLALTGIYLGPMLQGLDAVVPHSIQDTGLQATVLSDVSERLLHLDFTHLYDGSFFYPAHLTLAMSDAGIGLQVIALPLHLLGVDALLVSNLLIVASFPVTALAGDALGRYVTRARVGGLVVGTAFAFAAYRMEHIVHLNLLQSWTIPLAFLGLEMTLRERTRRGPILWAFALVAAGSTALHYLLMLAIVQPIYLLVRYLLTSDRRRMWAHVRRLVPPGLVAAAVIALLLVPYLLLRLAGYERSLKDTFDFSARLADYLLPTADSLALHGLYLLQPLKGGFAERQLFPGIVVIGFAALGLLVAFLRRDAPRLRRMAPWLVIGVVAFVLSLGPYLWPDVSEQPARVTNLIALPYSFLEKPLFLEALRSPARFGVIVLLVVAVAAAMALVRLLQHVPRGVPRSVAIGVLALAMAVEYSVSIPVVPVAWGPTLPPVYTWLRDQPPGPVVEFPAFGEQLSYYMLASTIDGHPRLDGWSGFTPRALEPIVVLVTARTLLEWLGSAHRLGAVYVVVHGDAINSSVLAAVHAEADGGTLVAVVTFGDDEVYRFRSP
ncbi:MAG: hypothetical protein ACRDF7_06880 [Candidatus Limnocylindrales bacterium]